MTQLTGFMVKIYSLSLCEEEIDPGRCIRLFYHKSVAATVQPCMSDYAVMVHNEFFLLF